MFIYDVNLAYLDEPTTFSLSQREFVFIYGMWEKEAAGHWARLAGHEYLDVPGKDRGPGLFVELIVIWLD